MYKDETVVQATFSEIKDHLAQRHLSKTTSTFLWHASNRLALITGVGIIALQQLTGAPAMLAYASTIFEEAGDASNSSVHMAMFQLFLTLISAALVEPYGRKVLLYTGCTSMAIALIVLAVCFDHYDSLVLIAMFVYIGGFQIGFGPIAWLIVAEVFSNELRSKATAVCVQVNFASYGLVQFAVPVVSSLTGYNGTFVIFALLSVYRYV